MSLFHGKNEGGIADVIRCDEENYLIWKWRPKGNSVNSTAKENSIRWGSSLRVKDGSVAVFIYNDHGEQKQDYIEGPFDKLIETSNLPILSGIIGLAYDGNSPFQAEVYFINLAELITLKFGVPYFDVFDPRFTDYAVPVAVRGSINFKITDYKEFIRLHRLDDFSIADFKEQTKNAITKYVKNVVANAPDEHGIPVVQLEKKITQINNLIEDDLKPRLFNEFGVTVSSVDVSAIEVDKSSDGYAQLKSVTQDLVGDTLKAKTEVEIKEMKAEQKLGVFSKAADIYSDFKDRDYARKKGKVPNVAEKIGDTAAKGAGIVGTIGGNFVQNLKNVVDSKKTESTPPEIPPVPATLYYVAKDGEATGPYKKDTLKVMLAEGLFSPQSLVWTSGMDSWEEARTIRELDDLFNAPNIPPIPNK